MKNKKGFTLVEIVFAVTILGIITMMAYPLIRNIAEKNTNTKYKQYAETLISSAKLYNDSFSKDLFKQQESGCAYITYKNMKEKKLVKDIQVRGISCDTENTFVKVVKSNKSYKYTAYLGCVSKDSGKIKVFIPKSPIPHKEDPSTCN